MMTRATAIDGVKIGHFIKLGLGCPTGVVHIGANDGYEFQFYLALEMKCIGYDPIINRCIEAMDRYSNDPLFMGVWCYAFDCTGGKQKTFLLADGDGQQSTFLPPIANKEAFSHGETVLDRLPFYTCRADECRVNWNEYDCLVIDVQGMELHVLAGFGRFLSGFKYLNIECSREPQYVGGVCAQSVIDFVGCHGFRQVFPDHIPEHDDILFVKERR